MYAGTHTTCGILYTSTYCIYFYRRLLVLSTEYWVRCGLGDIRCSIQQTIKTASSCVDISGFFLVQVSTGRHIHTVPSRGLGRLQANMHTECTVLPLYALLEWHMSSDTLHEAGAVQTQYKYIPSYLYTLLNT